MFVGVLKEAANHAHRVGLTPKRVGELVINGHNVVVETGAGHGINAEDDAYIAAGAEIVQTAAEVFANTEIIAKAIEPPTNVCLVRRDEQTLFTRSQLEAGPKQVKYPGESGAVREAHEAGADGVTKLPPPTSVNRTAGAAPFAVGASACRQSKP